MSARRFGEFPGRRTSPGPRDDRFGGIVPENGGLRVALADAEHRWSATTPHVGVAVGNTALVDKSEKSVGHEVHAPVGIVVDGVSRVLPVDGALRTLVGHICFPGRADRTVGYGP